MINNLRYVGDKKMNNDSIYFKTLEKIKSKGNIDFICIDYNDYHIVLKLIDDSDETVVFVTEVRKKFCHMFSSYFDITIERTKQWIVESLEKKDWIQFLVYVNGEKIGTIGNNRYDKSNNSAELDNLAKFFETEYRGLFNIVEKVYLKWMFDTLKLDKITEKLFTDNYTALNSHLKCGFKILGVIPSKRKFTNDGWVWENIILDSDDEFGERYYHKIELSKKDLIKNFEKIKFRILKNN
jgi:RimJ/RimL family protein N-acetyltransferase